MLKKIRENQQKSQFLSFANRTFVSGRSMLGYNPKYLKMYCARQGIYEKHVHSVAK